MMPTRRTLLAGLAATATTAAVGQPRGFLAAHGTAPGIQLYMLGDLVRRDPDGTLAAVRAAGIGTVEIAGLDGRAPAEWRRLLDRHRLTATSAHVPYDGDTPNLKDSVPALVAQYAPIGPRHLVLSAPIRPARFAASMASDWQGVARLMAEQTTADDWTRMADQLNRAGAAVKREGLRLAYHNHNMEFAPKGDSYGLAILLRDTDPALVDFELDIGWVVAAGHDPATLLARWPGRFRLLHVKDVAQGTRANFTAAMNPADVGAGQVGWSRLLPIAWRAGVRDFFLEQEPPFPAGRLAAMRAGARYLARV